MLEETQDNISTLLYSNLDNNIDEPFYYIAPLDNNIDDPFYYIDPRFDWNGTNYGVSEYNLKKCIDLLIILVKNDRFINLSKNEFIILASYIIKIDNRNTNSLLNLSKQLFIETIQTIIKSEDIIIKQLNIYIYKNINPNKLTIIDGIKQLLFVPQLERHAYWSNELLSHNVVKLMDEFRELIRYKYQIICCFIEDLLLKKTQLQNETIKLEFIIKNNITHDIIPLKICIEHNLLALLNINKNITNMLSKINLSLLYNKNRKFRICHDWWICGENIPHISFQKYTLL